jgi:hypothetical protein
LRAVIAAYSESLRSTGFFFALLDNGFSRVPMNTNAVVLTAGAAAYVVGEGLPKPISRVTTNSQWLTPRKAVGMLVISQELALSTGESGRRLFERELRNAVSVAVDAEALNVILDDVSATSGAAGGDTDAALADLRTLLSKVEVRGGRIVLLAAGDVALGLSLLPTIAGGQAFPQMTALGGMVAGIQCYVSDAIPDGQLVAVQTAAIAADAGEFETRVSRQAAIEMLDAALQQDGGTGQGAAMVSLFQANLMGIAIEARFGLEVIRPRAAAAITGATYALSELAS